MHETSLLVAEALPKSFEYRLRGRLALPHATVELHDYLFHRPQRALFESHQGFLDLALSPRPGKPRGSYVDAPRFAARPIGDVMFIPADHGLDSEWGAGPQRSVCCQFDAAAMAAHEGWSADALNATLDIRSPMVRDTLVRLAREIESPGFDSALMAEALCIQLGIELGRYFRHVDPEPVSGRPKLSARHMRRIEEMLDRPGKAPGVGELAAECGLSTRHFFRVFRAATGRTVSEFAAERRMAMAKALLLGEKPVIKQIAYRCGFGMPAAFSAAFRRATGLSPREYRLKMTS